MRGEKLVIGIDEAGRGPVVGSMFIAGVAMPESKLDELEQLNLKDSKKLSDKRRRTLERRIRQVVEEFHIKEVTASQIDELRKIMSLNDIELKAFCEIIQELEPDKVIVDLPEPNGTRFEMKMKKELGEDWDDLDITAEHKADDTYPIVSAASILAKNAREDHIEELKEKYNTDFKSGYPHDQPTRDFLKDHLKEHGELPEETRLSWSTAATIRKEHTQKGIHDYKD